METTVVAALLPPISHLSPKKHPGKRPRLGKVSWVPPCPQILLREQVVSQRPRLTCAPQLTSLPIKPPNSATISWEWAHTASMESSMIMVLACHTVRGDWFVHIIIPPSKLAWQDLARVRDWVQWIDISPRVARTGTLFLLKPTGKALRRPSLAHAPISPRTIFVATTASRAHDGVPDIKLGRRRCCVWSQESESLIIPSQVDNDHFLRYDFWNRTHYFLCRRHHPFASNLKRCWFYWIQFATVARISSSHEVNQKINELAFDPHELTFFLALSPWQSHLRITSFRIEE